MAFSDHPFDIASLWEARESRTEGPQPTKLTTQARRLPRNVDAEVVAFPRAPAVASNAASCRARTRAELRSIAMSLKLRDMLLRNAIAYRCAKCARCPDMCG